MTITAKIIGYDGKNMVVVPDVSVDRELIQKQINRVEIRLNDGRTITADQRRKAYATLRDIADYCGHEPEYLKEWFKYEYMIKTGGEYFSLSDCSVTVAREYINILVDFCLRYGVPLYGEETQENQCIEECAELIQAINKKHRGREHNIPEEIADVEICLEQLKMINNCADKVENYKTAKMERLKARITK